MSLNLRPLLSQLTLQDKNLNLRKFSFDDRSEYAWVQNVIVSEIERQYNAGKPVRIIVLKARQLGVSTVTQGVLYNWCFIHPGTNALTIGHFQETSDSIFAKDKLFWDNWPFRSLYTPRYNTKRHMEWTENRSSMRASTAKSIQIGRGQTFHAIHATECAFYPNPETLFTGINQTLPNKHGTFVLLESTAEGTGNWWHKQWLAAEAGETDYVPLFFPWFKHSEYTKDTTICTQAELEPYERWLMTLGATYANIAWRRWAIPNLLLNDEIKFKQEYPATPTEAFQSTGQAIFPAAYIEQCYKDRRGIRGFLIEDPYGAVRFVPDPNGQLTIYAKPFQGDSRQDRYFIGGDPSETVQGDPACFQVINRKTYEQVAVWHGRIHPVAFARQMMLVGKYYNYAMLCPEVMGGGQAAIATILTSNYPSVWQNKWADQAPGRVGNVYGWSNNFRNKSWCVGILKKLIVDLTLQIHDPETKNQLLNYVTRPDGTWGNADAESHDDAVMALAIAVTASSTEGPFVEHAPDVHSMTPQDNLNNGFSAEKIGDRLIALPSPGGWE